MNELQCCKLLQRSRMSASCLRLRRLILVTKNKETKSYLYEARVILDALIMAAQLILINNVIIIERLNNQPEFTRDVENIEIGCKIITKIKILTSKIYLYQTRKPFQVQHERANKVQKPIESLRSSSSSLGAQ